MRKLLFCLFVICEVCFGYTPSLDFQVNRNMSLFYQVYFEEIATDVYEDLYEEIKNSFGTLSASDDERAEFIDNLTELEKANYHHKYMTPNFMNLWTKASESYDRKFDSDFEILSSRALELQEYSKNALENPQLNLSEVFKFYNSELGDSSQFKVYVCSTFEQSGIFARAFGNNIVLKFNYGNRAADMCAILEQVCHRLFQTMRSDSKQAMKNYFLSSGSKNALPAYFLFEDVLAYAIGGLWTHSKLPTPHDSILPKPCDQKIEIIANAILQTVNNYLKNRKKLDKEFLKEYIKQFDIKFPKAYENYDAMLMRLSLIVENGIDVPECQNVITGKFEIKEILNEVGSYTTIFIGNNLGHPALRTIQEKLPNLNSEFMFVTSDRTGKLFIIIKTNDMRKVALAIDNLKSQPAIVFGYTKEL